jgi:hypothetical protein
MALLLLPEVSEAEEDDDDDHADVEVVVVDCVSRCLIMYKVSISDSIRPTVNVKNTNE